MSRSQDAIENAVLLTLFPDLCRLGDYLERHLQESLRIVQEDDSPEYKELLQSTLVAVNGTNLATGEKPGPVKPFPATSKPTLEGSQNDVVDLAIEQTCPRSRTWFNEPFNILAAGYTNSKKTYCQGSENRFPNTLGSIVRSSLWETLMRRIGDAAMLYLLTNTSMFVALPNNCYCQITGHPISEQSIAKRPLQRDLLASLSSRKRPASATSSSSPPSLVSHSNDSSISSISATSLNVSNSKMKTMHVCKKRKIENRVLLPAITFKRTRIFYFNQYHTASTMLRHFLLSNYGAIIAVPGASQPMSTVDAQIMRMFPRQYGLNNVFIQCDTARSTSLFGVYNTAAPMAPAASAKVPRHPWRLRQMREQVEKMLELNSMCAYKLLLQYYCPVKAIDEPSVTVDTSSAALLTYHSSFDQVTSFVHAVVKKVIPLAMFGSQENRIVILRAMTRFIRLRKFETMSLQYVLQGFRMSDCQWLQDTRLRKPDSRVHHTPPTASDKQHEILHEFLYWMFDGFLIPLLQASFYITDSSFQRNKIFYYRHELWQLITKPAVASIQKDMFIQLEQGEIAKCNQTYAKVRLLPKIHDLRPIINLRKKSSKLVNGTSSIGVKSMNQKLMNPFLILAYERDRQMAQRTSSAIGMSDLFYRCKQAKSRLVDSSGSESPKLYMVKVDIKKSFDSINQDKLLEIIDRVLKEDKYMIHRHSKVVPSNGRIMKRFLPKAIAATEVPPFLEFARDQAKMSKHAVIVDKVVHSYEGKTAVINMIRDHINTNIVKFGKHFYRQTTGIPQGSILSPALCRFFYDEMELNVLSDLTQSSDSELIRLADDFLFISQSREKAVSFLEIMAKGHPDYGCFINEKKTIVNFDVTLNGVPVQTCQGNEFPYCGLLLHTRTLEIRADYSRYHGEDIRNLLTVGRDMHPGRSITLKMKKGMQHMCQMAFSDTTFNSLSKVMLNIFQNFLFCAMKFHAYCQELRLDPVSAEHVHATALPSIVMGILRACYGLLHNGRRSAVGISASVKFEVAERHVQWLGATAFCRVLPRWPVYAPLRAMLQDKILGPLAANEKVHFKRMLHSIVSDERNKIMDNIRYT